MPGAEIAQYGIGFFALLVLAYALVQMQRQRRNNGGGIERLVAVVENNTRVTEQLVKVMSSFREAMLQVAARQETKLDELLARARRE